jgi:hypothetical protein
MQRTLLMVAAIAAALAAAPAAQASTRYYVDAAGNDAAAGTSPAHPWRSLARVQAATLRPGDTVAFRRGSTFSGSATIAGSGTLLRPIRLTAYGSGAAPVLTNPGGLNMLHLTGDRIVVSDLAFRDGVAFDNRDGTGITGPKYEQSGAIAIATGADDVTVTGNAFTAVGLGVKTYGLRTRVERNVFEHLVIAFRGVDAGAETSYGAVGVSVNNSFADVGWNRFIDCRSTDSPYGADGGAVEIEGFQHTKDHIRIHHNFSSGSQGFVEATETSTSDVELSYNVSDDYQQFLAFDTTTAPSGYRVLHNTVLRRSALNTTAFFAGLYYREVVAEPSPSWLRIRDNVFYADSQKVLRGSYTFAPFEFPHDHNVLGGQPDPLGYPLGDGDVIADPRFVAGIPATGFVTDPSQLALRADSAAIGRAVTRPARVDILGHPIPLLRRPDAGAVEYTGSGHPRPEDPVVLGPEQLTDPGFEAQPGGPVVAPWSRSGPGSVAAIAGDAHGGDVFTRLVASSSGFTVLRRQVSVTPGQKYRLRMWVRTSEAICSSCIYYGVKTTSGSVVREFIASTAPGWTELAVDFTPATSRVFVQLGAFGSAADRVDTDDWSLTTRS